MLLTGALLLFGLAFGFWRLSDPHRTKARLDIPSYVEAPQSFSGNSYVVDALIVSRLSSNPKGAVYACSVGNHALAIVVPNDAMPSYNIEKGQRLWFDVRIGHDGAAIATAISKK